MIIAGGNIDMQPLCEADAAAIAAASRFTDAAAVAVADQFIRSFPLSLLCLAWEKRKKKKAKKKPTTKVTPKFAHALASSSLNQANKIGGEKREGERKKRSDIFSVVADDVRRVRRRTSPQPNTQTHISIHTVGH